MPLKMLVTSALPYANGDIHLGHLVEYIQTDIWVRAQKMRGHACYYVCADDTHGTPIMLRAQKEGTTPEELIARMGKAHLDDFRAFHIEFDNYYTTHSPENRALSEYIYNKAKEKGYIATRVIEQFFDPEAGIFLPDRFIIGECPRCHAKEQYGDVCEVCGASYSPAELIEPRSAVSGAVPIKKETEHYFFRLSLLSDFLWQWVHEGHLEEHAVKKLEEWFAQGLADWDITRDAPYFGFEIPDVSGKYFYVWLDAPIGYMASFMNLCQQRGLVFEEFWGEDSKTHLYHFIGKDILYFHALFWPAVLSVAGFRTPTKIFPHGFLTVNGQKMSKSRGTFITARSFAERLPTEYLRYYFAAKITPSIEDIDLSFTDFQARINADLVGKYFNIASRAAPFLARHFNNRLGDRILAPELVANAQSLVQEIKAYYEQREYGKLIRAIMAIADETNQFWDMAKPWDLAKDPQLLGELQAICTTAINLFRLMTLGLKPILPQTAERVERFLKTTLASFDDANTLLLNHSIANYERLGDRIKNEDLATLMATPTSETKKENNMQEPASIDMETFQKIDLRIGRVVSAEAVEGADKLLKLMVDIGEAKPRTVFSGIKAAYSPDDLLGKEVVVIANLQPRKMRFGVSEAMILAAGDGTSIALITPDKTTQPGAKVK